MFFSANRLKAHMACPRSGSEFEIHSAAEAVNDIDLKVEVDAAA